MAKELLCAAVDQPWSRAAPHSAFERINASYVSASGAQRHDDLVWKLSLAPNDELYFLVEFQSRSDPRMVERMQSYTALLAEDLAKQRKSGRLQILPIVLYTGRARWHAKTSVSTMSAGQSGLGPIGSQFSYLLIDRTAIRDKTNIVYLLLHLDRLNTKNDDLGAAIMALNLWIKRQSNQQLVQTVESLIALKIRSTIKHFALQPAIQLEDVMEIFERQFDSYLDLLKFQHARRERCEGLREGRKQGKLLGREVGRREGRQEGKQEGKLEGLLQARQEMIRLIIESKPAQLSRAATARVESADLVTLDHWIVQLLAGEMPAALKA